MVSRGITQDSSVTVEISKQHFKFIEQYNCLMIKAEFDKIESDKTGDFIEKKKMIPTI